MTNPILNNNNNNNNNILKGGADELEKFVMENCLMLFKTQAANAAAAAAQAAASSGLPDDMSRTFTCKTCGKKFHSFQALGGHRASHKKLKPVTDGADVLSLVPAKPKSHACSICGTEFPTGQALGGHMRRHRAVVDADVSANNKSIVTTTSNTTEVSDGNNSVKKRKIEEVLEEEVKPVLKRSNSSKRVCLDFNLSFAPWVDKKEDEINGGEFEEGEIVEQEEDEDFLKLELRQPIRN